MYTDEALAAMAIQARNEILDRLDDEAEAEAEAEARWEAMMEARAEIFWTEGPHGSQYAGSEEESRDRWLDSLVGR